MPINRFLDKENIEYTHNGVLLTPKATEKFIIFRKWMTEISILQKIGSLTSETRWFSAVHYDVEGDMNLK